MRGSIGADGGYRSGGLADSGPGHPGRGAAAAAAHPPAAGHRAAGADDDRRHCTGRVGDHRGANARRADVGPGRARPAAAARTDRDPVDRRAARRTRPAPARRRAAHDPRPAANDRRGARRRCPRGGDRGPGVRVAGWQRPGRDCGRVRPGRRRSQQHNYPDHADRGVRTGSCLSRPAGGDHHRDGVA